MNDYAYNELLEAKEKSLLRRERMEERILNDNETFQRIANLYGRECLSEPGVIGMLDFGVERLIREEDPEYTDGWRTV